ncbi:MAG: hypothetical protein ACPLRM_06705, partial [Anaerolineae bacterium]
DEPYAGLDQHAAELVNTLLYEWQSSGGTILMTTHDLTWATGVSNAVLVLLNGCVVYQAETSTLSERDIRDVYRQYAGGCK